MDEKITTGIAIVVELWLTLERAGTQSSLIGTESLCKQILIEQCVQSFESNWHESDNAKACGVREFFRNEVS